MSGDYSKKKEARFLSSVDKSQIQDYEKYEQDGVSINDLRAMIGKNHPEFKTKQMQDALEYLQHVFNLVEKEEANNKQDPIQKIFQFKTINKLKCMTCNGVKLKVEKTNEQKLPILPPTKEQLQHALQEQQERSQKLSREADSSQQPPKEDAKLLEEPEYNITFEQCINILKHGDVVELNCQKCQTKMNFTSRYYFKTLPKYLIVPTNRLVLENWVPKKLNAIISIHQEFDFKDLVFPGLAQDEIILESQEGNANAGGQKSDEPQVDEIALLQIMEMGITENRARRALIKFNNNTEAAMNFVFENMDDASQDLPLEVKKGNKQGGFVVNEENLMLLSQMGFETEQCKRALKKFNNNVELALDGLSQGEYYEEDKEEGQGAGKMEEEDLPITSTKYELQGAIVHIGKSVHSGHYVAYVKRDNHWIYYNDAKVAEAEEPALGKGYIYIFRQK